MNGSCNKNKCQKIATKLAFWLTLAISVWGMFAFSVEPLIIQNTLLAEIFAFDVPGESILFTITTSIVVSYIFYFIVVYLPEKQKRENIRPYLTQTVYTLTREMSSIIGNVSRYTKTDNIYNLSKDEFVELVGSIQAGAILVQSQSNYEEYQYLNIAILNDINELFKGIETLEPYFIYLDTEIVSALVEVRRSRDLIGHSEFLANIHNNKRDRTLKCYAEPLFCLKKMSQVIHKANKSILKNNNEYPINSLEGSHIFDDKKIIDNFLSAYKMQFGEKVDVTVDINKSFINVICEAKGKLPVVHQFSNDFRTCTGHVIYLIISKVWRDNPALDKSKLKFSIPLEVEILRE